MIWSKKNLKLSGGRIDIKTAVKATPHAFWSQPFSVEADLLYRY